MRDAKARIVELDAIVRSLSLELEQAREEIELTWQGINRSFEMEPRELIERESKDNGFKYPLVQAVHTIWKRDPKVDEAVRSLEQQLKECYEASCAEVRCSRCDQPVPDSGDVFCHDCFTEKAEADHAAAAAALEGLKATMALFREAAKDEKLSDGAARCVFASLGEPITEADIQRTLELAEQYGWKRSETATAIEAVADGAYDVPMIIASVKAEVEPLRKWAWIGDLAADRLQPLIRRLERKLAAALPPSHAWCWEHRDRPGYENPALEGCSGKGRPSCTTAECLYGVEPCSICGHFKAVDGACGFVHLPPSRTPQETP